MRYETCGRMRCRGVHDGTAEVSTSSSLLSSKSTMPPDAPPARLPFPRPLARGAETTDRTRPPGLGPKLILSSSRHDASSASWTNVFYIYIKGELVLGDGRTLEKTL